MTMTTTNNEGGSRLYSTFSLRPPLPANISTIGIIDRSSSKCGSIPVDANGNGDTATNIVSSDRQRQSSSPSPSPSFLFRMYVACHVLRVATETRFTALVFLHRYAQAKKEAHNDNSDANDDDWPWVGAACLFLACKAEDEPRRLRDVINMAQMVLSSTNNNNNNNNDDDNNDNDNDNDKNDNRTTVNNVITINMSRPPSLNGAYWDSKQKAIETEQLVLRWLGFDCSVSHPHRAVFWILEKEIVIEEQCSREENSSSTSSSVASSSSSVAFNKNDLLHNLPMMPRKRKHDDTSTKDDDNDDGNKKGIDSELNNHYINDYRDGVRDKILPLAFQRLNDALFYPLALRWGIVELACAAIDLALDGLGQDDNDATNNTATVATDTTTRQSMSKKNKNSTSNSSIKAIFKKEWWNRYEVSNEDFNDCKNSLKEATSYLKTVATTTASIPDPK